MSRCCVFLVSLLVALWLKEPFRFFVTAVDDAITSNHLRVSIRNHFLKDAPSCQHSIAQVELLNLHSSDHIRVRSIRTTDERTVSQAAGVAGKKVKSSPAPSADGDAEDECYTDLPRQLQASKLPGDFLDLGPGQVAIVPVTFLPRFPPLPLDDESIGFDNQWKETDEHPEGLLPPLLSPFQEADWLDMLEDNDNPSADDTKSAKASPSLRYHRNNLAKKPSAKPPSYKDHYSRYHVTTTILVETDSGDVELPLELTSVRENSFGLPDVIYFDMNDEESDPESSVIAGHAMLSDIPNNEDDEDRRIRETVSLFQAVKEKEKQQMMNVDEHDDEMGGDFYTALRNSMNGVDADISDASGRSSNSSSVWIADSKRLMCEKISSGEPNVSASIRNTDTQIDRTSEDIESQDCFDVYLRNPEQTFDLRVTEVQLSKPGSTSLYILPGKAKGAEHLLASLPPRNVINKWKESKSVFGDDADEGLTVPADGKQHYLVTICATKSASSASSQTAYDRPTVTDYDYKHAELSEWIDSGLTELGFLQIKTTHDTMFVGLQRAKAEMRKRMSLAADAGSFAQVGSGRSSLSRENYRTNGLSQRSNFTFGRPTNDTTPDEGEKSLVSSPDRIDFHFLSSTCLKSESSIDLVNESSQEVQIMRAAIALQPLQLMETSSFSGSGLPELDEMGIKVAVEGFDKSLSKPLTEDRAVVSAITVSCSVDRDKFQQHFSHNASVSIHGALVLRGSTQLGWSYEEWEQAVKADPFLDSDAVLEVPLSISIADGKVGFLKEASTHPVPSFFSMELYAGIVSIVTSTFFPIHPLFTTASLTRSEKALLVHDDLKGFDHHFRVFSNLDVNIVVDKVEIAGDDDSNDALNAVLCSRFEAFILERGKSDLNDLGNFTDLGLVYVKYRFPETNALHTEDLPLKLPTTCYLLLRTEPDTGVHEMPLVIYSGRIDVSGSPFQSESLANAPKGELAKEDGGSSTWNYVSFGFDNLLDWFQTTKAGYALRSILKAPSNTDRDRPLLERYLYSLCGKPPEAENTKLRPVLLRVGAVAQGETETLPLYVTNYNPVPVSLRIDVGEVEGMTIAVGRDDGNNALDYVTSKRSIDSDDALLPEYGRFRGHPANGVRRFLCEDELSRMYFQKFPFRDDVSMSMVAISKFPILRKLFKRWAVAKFHRLPFPRRFTPSGWSRCLGTEHPPLYGPFQKKLTLSGRKSPGPIIISSDRKTARRLPVCWDFNGEPEKKETDGNVVVVPPGGVARFDVSLRAPPSTVLEKDITQFLATGLSLSSDHGEIIPVVVAFDALQGKLQLSHIPSAQSRNHGGATELDSTLIRVPARIFRETSDAEVASIKIPSHSLRSVADLTRGATIVPRNATSSENGVTLFMKSSFLREVQLRKIESCNPWFEVLLMNHSDAEADPFLGVNIGAVTSAVPCPADGVTLQTGSFPSFFRCATNWLAKRSELQPRGCGILSGKQQHWVDGNLNGERGGMDGAIQSLQRALLVTEWSDETSLAEKPLDDIHAPLSVKSSHRRSDGVVPPIVIEAMARACDALRSASDSGLLSMRTSLRAVIEYNSTPEEISPVSHDSDPFDELSRLLSIAIRNVTIESVLETPKLLLNKEGPLMTSKRTAPGSLIYPPTIEFEPTEVANVASLMLPLKNPTSVPVRVRLGVAPLETGVDDSIRNRYLGTYQSPYVQTGRKTPSSPKDYAHHQWWDNGGAFFHADLHGDMIRSHYNITIKSGTGAQISLVNPSFLANTAFLVGCGSRCGLRNENQGKKPFESIVNLTPTSPIGASAAAGQTLVGRQRTATQQGSQVEGGHISIAAGGSLIAGGMGPAAFGIPYSALDEIVIPPFETTKIGPIFFRPPGRSGIMGCESTKGGSKTSSCGARVFESMLLLENSLTGLERVLVQGKALWEKIVFLDPVTDSFGDIEVRNGVQTLLFPGTIESTTPISGPTLKEVVVQNDGDVPVVVTRWYLSPTPKIFKTAQASFAGRCELNHFRILGCHRTKMVPFTLFPGHNISVFIEHHPQCTKRKDYVALNLEIGRVPENRSSTHETRFEHQVKSHQQASSLRKRKIELLVGYEMSAEVYASCSPLTKYSGSYDSRAMIVGDSVINSTSLLSTKVLVGASVNEDYLQYGLDSAILGLSVLALAIWLVLLHGRFALLQRASKKFLRFVNFKTGSAKNTNPSPVSVGKTWSAALRCLARADPTSSELQNLGREQTSKLLLARFNAVRVLPPQCFSSTGVASRERPNAAAAAARQRTAGTGSRRPAAGNERVRASEAIFGHYSPNVVLGKGYLPSRLGWRTAASRGFIDSTSLDSSQIDLKSEALWLRRKSQPALVDTGSVEGSEMLGGSGAFNNSTSDLDSSYDDRSGEDDIPKTLHRPGVLVSDGATSAPELNKEDEQAFIVHGKRGFVQQNRNGSSQNHRPVQERKTELTQGTSAEASDSSGHLNTKPTEKRLMASKVEGKETDPRALNVKNDSKNSDVKVSTSTTVKAKRAITAPTRQSSYRNKTTSETPSSKRKDTSQQGSEQRAKEGSKLIGQKEKVGTFSDLKGKDGAAASLNEDTVNTKGKSDKDRAKKGKKGQRKVQSPSTPKSSPKSPPKQKQNSIPSSSPLSVSDSPGSPPALRPPPGLPPPPGFGSASNTPLRSPKAPQSDAMLSSETISGDGLFVPQHLSSGSTISILDHAERPQIVARNVSDLSATHMDTPERATQPSMPGCSNPSVFQTDSFPPVGLGLSSTEGQPEHVRPMDFDVMDFLDGILEEGNPSASADDIGGLISEATSAAPTTAMFPSPVLSSNPWAMDSSEENNLASRASAYGVAMEETSERTVDSDPVNNIPLLTPAAIFSPREEEKDDDLGNAFYSSLGKNE